MHVGKAVEGEGTREGLYIRWAFTLSPSHPRLRQISSTENQDYILTHSTLVVMGGRMEMDRRSDSKFYLGSNPI